MPRGGKRPGAGAPRGNLNALKHGRRSAQLAMLGALLASNPKIRDSLLDLARRHQIRQSRADEVATDLLTRILNHAHDIAAGKASSQPFEDAFRTHAHLLGGAEEPTLSEVEELNVQSHEPERRSIKETAPARPPVKHHADRKKAKRPPHNQRPTVIASENQTPLTESPPKTLD